MKSVADVRLFLDKKDKKLYNICVIPFVIMYGAQAGILIWVIIALQILQNKFFLEVFLNNL